MDTPSSINHRLDPAVPIADLTLHPKNPREGDIGAIHGSLEANGFYGVIVVQESTGYVLVGNHRLQAARAAGMDTVPVAFVDVDDELALRILLADNRTAELATNNDAGLAKILQDLQQTGDALDGTGYDSDDLDQLLHDLERTSPLSDDAGSAGLPTGVVIKYEIVFDTEAQQQRFYDWIRGLKRTYPDEPTVAARIVRSIDEQG